MDNSSIQIFAGFCLYVILFGGVGYIIGSSRNRGAQGFVLGVLLCLLGWIITALLGENGRKCPEFLGVIPFRARRCRHCGSAVKVVADPETSGEAFYIDHEGKTDGPFTRVQLRMLVKAGKLSKQTLCAREIDKEWTEVGTII